jgi:phosphonatase-like hydrolase
VGDTPRVSLVCCDLASTVIDGSVLERAFAEAIAAQGLVAGTQSYTRAMVRLDRARGRPPADIMREVFDGNEAQAAVAALAFDQSFRAAADRFGVAAPSGFADALSQLTAVGIKVCLLTTLSRGAIGPLADEFRRLGMADLTLCRDDAPRGFPWPDLVLTALLRLGADDVREVAVVGATESCMESGQRAGAGLVVGLADGARRAAALRQAGATRVIDGLAAFPALVAPAA